MDISVMFTSVENYIIYVFQVMDISVMFMVYRHASSFIYGSEM